MGTVSSQNVVICQLINGMKLLCRDWGNKIQQMYQYEETEEDSQSESLPIPKITSYKEAIIALEDIQDFLETHRHEVTFFTYIGPAVDAITSIKVRSMRQRSLHDYLS